MKAVWNSIVLAQSNDTVVVEGNHYFPAESLKKEYFEKSKNIYHCPSKGYADYYHVIVEGEMNLDCAWVYPHPYPEAADIKGKFGFWKGIEVIDNQH